MIKPLGPRLLILVDKDEPRMTSGGIHLSKDAYFDRVLCGTVKGRGRRVEDFSEGDRVMFSYRSGVQIDDDFTIVRASDVLGVEDAAI